MIDLKKHKLVWIQIAEYYGRELTEEQLRMYTQDTDSLDPEKLMEAFKKYRMSLGKRFPLPIDLKQILEPIESDKNYAIKHVSNILKVVSKQGMYWNERPSFLDNSLNYLGTIGITVINARGGWQDFCRSFDKSVNKETFKAQLRDEIISYIEDYRRQGYDIKRTISPYKNKNLLKNLLS